MANTCAICGAEVNLIKGQKLADGNYICRKNCRSKCMKLFDCVHADLNQVQAHIAQVEKGTKLYEHYFVEQKKERSKDKNNKLHNFWGKILVAPDIGLMAIIQVNYKFMFFGKSTRACVYRIADLCDYEYEEEKKTTSKGIETVRSMYISFVNAEGMFDCRIPLGSVTAYKDFMQYFNKLFKIEKTFKNAKNNLKSHINAVKSTDAGVKAMMSGADNAEEKVATAAKAIDAAVLGDRTELERRADEALAAFPV